MKMVCIVWFDQRNFGACAHFTSKTDAIVVFALFSNWLAML